MDKQPQRNVAGGAAPGKAVDAPPGADLAPGAALAALREVLARPGVRVLVLTGAGLSAPSGLGTYRGAGGMYPSGVLPPLHARDARAERVHLLWQHLGPLAAQAAAAAPNAAHHALAGFAAARPDARVMVATQNVDGLHHRAQPSAPAAQGSAPGDLPGGVVHVAELHGSLRQAHCLNPKCARSEELTWPPAPAQSPGQEAGKEPGAQDLVPRCGHCQARMRPAVVLFGEKLPAPTWAAAGEFARSADVALAVGTSLQVIPASGLVEQVVASGRPGFWLDLDPGPALDALEPYDQGWARQLTQVPGDVSQTLPDALGAPAS